MSQIKRFKEWSDPLKIVVYLIGMIKAVQVFRFIPGRLLCPCLCHAAESSFEVVVYPP